MVWAPLRTPLDKRNTFGAGERSGITKTVLLNVFGSDAFETGTGVHASAVVKALRKGDSWLADRVYSGVPAGDYGLEQVIRVGHMSGKSNIIHWLEAKEIEVEDSLVEYLFNVAKSKNRLMTDEELLLCVQAHKEGV